jgi:hypothetical protein
VRKERLNKLKSKTIVALLYILKDNNFIYRTRVNIKESIINTIIIIIISLTPIELF